MYLRLLLEMGSEGSCVGAFGKAAGIVGVPTGGSNAQPLVARLTRSVVRNGSSMSTVSVSLIGERTPVRGPVSRSEPPAARSFSLLCCLITRGFAFLGEGSLPVK